MTRTNFIQIDEDKCVNCHQCIAVCPVKYCNDGSGDHIALDPELCIQCGNCLEACTHGARSIVDNLDEVLSALKHGRKTCAIVAPATVACFSEQHLRINGWLAALGVDAIFDVSFGAELTVRSYVEHIKTANPQCVIAQPCPVIATYIQLYRPELLPFLAPVLSPMSHTVRMIQTYYPQYRDHLIVAISPCVAKAREFRDTGLGVYNVTLASIEKHLDRNRQQITNFPERNFDNPPAERAVLFSSPAGLRTTLSRELPDIELHTRTIEGRRVFNYLDGLLDSIRAGNAPRLVDCLNCELGCNGGTGTPNLGRGHPDQLEARVRARHKRLRAELPPNAEPDAAINTLRAAVEAHWCNDLYHCEYTDRSDTVARIKEPSEQELTRIYHSMLKYTDADILNCSSCGYDSCAGMAKAIHNGLNRAQNCHLYLQKQVTSHMFDNVDVGIVLVDPESHEIVHANNVALGMLNTTRDAVEGHVCHNFICPTDVGRCPISDLNQTVDRSTRALLTADGTRIPILKTVKRIEIGGREMLLESFVDISDRQHTEEQLRQTNLSLERQTSRANRLAARAEAANAAKSQFLANMSHEIRTPMTAILGFAEAAREGCPANCQFGQLEHRDYLDTITRNGQHLLQVINDILDLSKIEAGKLTVERIACSPAQIIAEAVSLVRPRAAAKALELKADCDGPIPATILTDPIRFRQILINLLSNAVKFTKSGSVTLTTRITRRDTAEPILQIDVADSGVGMNRQQAAALFQPFSQADTSTTRKFGGTGLGLVISKRLAEALGGNVQLVESSPGKGSRFRLTIATGALDGIPLLEQTPPAPTKPPESNHENPTDGELSRTRILLAEDGPDNQRLIAHVLRKAGAQLTIVENGQRAFDAALAAQADENPFDLILMDMQMPVMDGYTATKALRSRGYAGLIIALTAHAMASDREACLNAGCDDYASKPIDRKELIATIRRHTRPKKPAIASHAS